MAFLSATAARTSPATSRSRRWSSSAGDIPGTVVTADYPYLCSAPGQQMVIDAIEEHDLDRVVVAACSPQLHEPTFRAAAAQAGLNPHLCEMANIREHCSWVHRDTEQATAKACQTVVAAVERVKRSRPLDPIEVPVTKRALVIGGGVAGIRAALDMANAGHPVVLVERQPSIGGNMSRLSETFPTLDCSQCILTPLMVQVSRHPNIELLTYSEVEEVVGLRRQLQGPHPQETELRAGRGLHGLRRLRRGLPGSRAATSSTWGCRAARRSTSRSRRPCRPPTPSTPTAASTPSSSRRPGSGCWPASSATRPASRRRSTSTCSPRSSSARSAPSSWPPASTCSSASRPTECGYGKHRRRHGRSRVRTHAVGLRARPTARSGGRPTAQTPKDVVFIQCVGSRDPEHGVPYCSRICCMYTAKHALLLQAQGAGVARLRLLHGHPRRRQGLRGVRPARHGGGAGDVHPRPGQPGHRGGRQAEGARRRHPVRATRWRSTPTWWCWRPPWSRPITARSRASCGSPPTPTASSRRPTPSCGRSRP